MRLLAAIIILMSLSLADFRASAHPLTCLVTGHKNITEQYVHVGMGYDDDIYVFYIAKLYVTVYAPKTRPLNSTARQSYNKRYRTAEIAKDWQNKYVIGTKHKCWTVYNRVVFSKDKTWKTPNIISLIAAIVILIPCMIVIERIGYFFVRVIISGKMWMIIILVVVAAYAYYLYMYNQYLVELNSGDIIFINDFWFNNRVRSSLSRVPQYKWLLAKYPVISVSSIYPGDLKYMSGYYPRLKTESYLKSI